VDDQNLDTTAWASVASVDQLIGTWSGSKTETVPADDEEGTPAFSQTVKMTFTVTSSQFSIKNEVDMSSLIALYEQQQAGAGAQMWLILSAFAQFGSGTDDETGMTTTITTSTGAPYIITTTTTGSSETVSPMMLAEIKINDSGNKIVVPDFGGVDDEGEASSIILSKK